MQKNVARKEERERTVLASRNPIVVDPSQIIKSSYTVSPITDPWNHRHRKLCCAVLGLLSESSHLISLYSTVQVRPPPYI